MKKESLRTRFIREMEIRNYSSRTIKSYVATLAVIAGFYHQSPDKLSVDQIKKYLHYCKQDLGRSVSTINQTISALKILFEDVLRIPWENIRIKRPRRNKHLPDILSKEEIFKMIRITKNIKHKAILALLYSSGIRRQELLDLKIDDIDSKRMMIRIQNGKGNKSRNVPLSINSLKILRKYYSYCHPEKYLFEGYNQGVAYSATSLNNIVRKTAQKAGVTKHIHTHSLRHTFATHLLEKGVNLKVIQKLLGHSSMRTTALYLHLAKIDFNKFKNPFDEFEQTI